MYSCSNSNPGPALRPPSTFSQNTTSIGAYKGTSLHGSSLPYVSDLVSNFPSPVKSSTEVPDAVEVYRRTLAAAADSSVVISSIGLLTNLADLLNSTADSYSTLSGTDLVKKKVRALFVMGGKYPVAQGGPECNICGCYNSADGVSKETASQASSFVAAKWPTQIVWVSLSLHLNLNYEDEDARPRTRPSLRSYSLVRQSGFEVGVAVQSGSSLSSCAPRTNPCRVALENFEGGPNKSRFSWDPLTTLAAVRGIEGAHCSKCTGCNGRNEINATTGLNTWVTDPSSLQTYIVLVNATAASDTLNDLLCAPPRKG